jgi:hypothetical protein
MLGWCMERDGLFEYTNSISVSINCMIFFEPFSQSNSHSFRQQEAGKHSVSQIFNPTFSQAVSQSFSKTLIHSFIQSVSQSVSQSTIRS